MGRSEDLMDGNEGEIDKGEAMYDLILTEGDLRRILAGIERQRFATGRPHCVQIHIEPGPDPKLYLGVVKATIEVLSPKMIAEMRAKGQLDFEIEE